ncbi:apoptosis antagonizing transcription factor-domain-containing protein [Dipodascopsis tothii]|uniref:apoptosis antagonizing transcription factor-domain-containing protein n=1 Tax=Dipodascopsis tothii TaxID=44089 RepID=UPI0034CEECFB
MRKSAGKTKAPAPGKRQGLSKAAPKANGRAKPAKKVVLPDPSDDEGTGSEISLVDSDAEASPEDPGEDFFSADESADEAEPAADTDDADETAGAGSADDVEDDDEVDDDADDASDVSDASDDEAAAKKAKTQSMGQRGRVVRQQMAAFDSLLDCRIQMQKGLVAANSLPVADEFASFADDETDELVTRAQEAAFLLLDKIVDLRLKLIRDNNMAAKNALPQKRKHTSVEDGLESCDQLVSATAAYRTGVLEKWSQKVRAASGQTILDSKKFSALNQSISAQVQTSLRDMDRLLLRTRVNRANVKPLTKNTDAVDESPEGALADGELKGNAESTLFDDTDFYQALLKDLVDKRMVDSGAATGVRWTVAKPKTKRANVDTKASKGRKLRYHVQEKVQNFMVPIPTETWTANQVDDLFSGLFGQQMELSETADADADKAEPEDLNYIDVDALNDGVRIFG